MRYARCPRCWRMDLARWNKNDYHVSFLKGIMLALGGNPYRCEYCRVNFVSFRKRKERYVPHARKKRRHKEGSLQELEQRGPEAAQPSAPDAPLVPNAGGETAEPPKQD